MALNLWIPWSAMTSVYTTCDNVTIDILLFNKVEILFKSLSCRWIKSNKSCNSISTGSVCYFQKSLSFILHLYWIGAVVCLNSNVTGDSKLWTVKTVVVFSGIFQCELFNVAEEDPIKHRKAVKFFMFTDYHNYSPDNEKKTSSNLSYCHRLCHSSPAIWLSSCNFFLVQHTKS